MYINDPYFPLIYNKILYWSKKKNSIFLMKYKQHPYFASISAFNKSCTGRLSSQSSIVSRNFPLKRLPYNNNKSPPNVALYEAMYSRMDQKNLWKTALKKLKFMMGLNRPYHLKFFNGCLPQILLRYTDASFLNKLSHIIAV